MIGSLIFRGMDKFSALEQTDERQQKTLADINSPTPVALDRTAIKCTSGLNSKNLFVWTLLLFNGLPVGAVSGAGSGTKQLPNQEVDEAEAAIPFSPGTPFFTAMDIDSYATWDVSGGYAGQPSQESDSLALEGTVPLTLESQEEGEELSELLKTVKDVDEVMRQRKAAGIRGTTEIEKLEEEKEKTERLLDELRASLDQSIGDKSCWNQRS